MRKGRYFLFVFLSSFFVVIQATSRKFKILDLDAKKSPSKEASNVENPRKKPRKEEPLEHAGRLESAVEGSSNIICSNESIVSATKTTTTASIAEPEEVDTVYLNAFKCAETSSDWIGFLNIWSFDEHLKNFKNIIKYHKSDPQVIKNLIKFRILANPLKSEHVDSFFEIAARRAPLEVFKKAYEQIKSAMTPETLFDLMLFSLLHENFQVSEFILSQNFEINFVVKERTLIGALIEESNPKNFGPLMERLYHSNAITWLLNHGADMIAKIGNCKIPLIRIAIVNSNEEALKIFLNANADLNATDNENSSLIYLAVEENNISAIETLHYHCLKHGNSVAEFSNAFYRKILNFNTSNRINDLKTIQWFVNNNFKPISSSGKTSYLLHYCTFHVLNDILEIFLKSGVNPMERIIDYNSLSSPFPKYEAMVFSIFKIFLEHFHAEDPAIALAVANGNIEAVKLFLEYGVDINLTVNGVSESLLHVALKGNCADIVEFLIANNIRWPALVAPSVKRFNRLNIPYRVVKWNCGHFNLSPKHNIFTASTNKSCIKCLKAINFQTYILYLLNLENFPDNFQFRFPGSKQSLLTEPSILFNLLSSNSDLKFINNSTKLGLFEGNPDLPLILNLAAESSSPAKFEILYEIFKKSPFFNSQSPFYLMKLSLLHENFGASNCLVRNGFDINSKSQNNEHLLGSLIEASFAVKPFEKRKYYENSIQWLIKNGADINVTHGPESNSLIAVAVLLQSPALKPMLEFGTLSAETKAVLRKFNMSNPICLASKYGNVMALKIFIEQGIKIFDEVPVNSSTFLAALFHNQLPSVKYLLSFQELSAGDVNSSYWFLHHLAAKGFYDMLQFLISYLKINLMERCKISLYNHLIRENPSWIAFFSHDDPAIVVAIAKNNILIVKLFLDSGVDPNLKIPSCSKTLLELAIELNCTEIAELLVAAGSEIESSSRAGYEQLCYDVCGRVGCAKTKCSLVKLRCGHFDHAICLYNQLSRSSIEFYSTCSKCKKPTNYTTLVKLFILSDKFPEGFIFKPHLFDWKSNLGIYFYLCRENIKKEAVKKLFEGGFPSSFTYENKSFFFLFMASCFADLEKFKYIFDFLSTTIVISIKDISLTYFMPSIMSKNFKVTEYLKDRFDISFNCLANNLHTAMSLAITTNADFNLDILKWLIEKGAEVNFPAGPEKQEPILFAVSCGNNSALKMLLEAGANYEVTNSEGFSPVTLAASIGNIKALEIFLDFGVNIEKQFKEKIANPVHIALIFGKEDTFKYLISHQIKPISEDGRTRYLLHLLACFTHEKIDLALKNGANPLEKCSDRLFEDLIKNNELLKAHFCCDDPAIAIPIIKDNIKSVEVFLNHGVSPNICIRNSSSLLHLACELQRIEIARLLISRGADTKMKNYQGLTALQLISSKKQRAELLNLYSYDIEI